MIRFSLHGARFISPSLAATAAAADLARRSRSYRAATGNVFRNARVISILSLPDDPDHFVRWLSAAGGDGASEGIEPTAPVVVVGTGLTMVGVVLALVARGHVAPIRAVSRHGLLPRAHTCRRSASGRALSPDAGFSTRALPTRRSQAEPSPTTSRRNGRIAWIARKSRSFWVTTTAPAARADRAMRTSFTIEWLAARL